MFTENVRETYFPVHYGLKKFFMEIYEKTKMPLVHIVGGFPVKMVGGGNEDEFIWISSSTPKAVLCLEIYLHFNSSK